MYVVILASLPHWKAHISYPHLMAVQTCECDAHIMRELLSAY